MNFEVTYTYSPESSKIISRQFLILRNGWSSIFVWSLLGIGGVATSFSSSYPIRWIGGFLVASVLIYILQSMSYVRNATRLASELPNKSIVVKFDDENITFQSEDHISITKWKRFSQVWITKHAWLFFIYSRDSYTAVPSSCISEELGAFILSKVTKDRVRNYLRKKKHQ
jgi:hypothetical protein